MLLALFLVLASADPGVESRRDVADALTLLNNYIESVSFADACRHRDDMSALRQLEHRIDAARRRSVAALPSLTGVETAGDTDFVCLRSSDDARVSRRLIRRDVERLLIGLERALDAEEAAPVASDR